MRIADVAQNINMCLKDVLEVNLVSDGSWQFLGGAEWGLGRLRMLNIYMLIIKGHQTCVCVTFITTG